VRLRTFITAAGRFGKAAESTLLVLILGGMIALAFAQIVLRNFFDIGLQWSDELLRMLVLWVALAGAVAASRSDKHINIAVLDRFLPLSFKRWVSLLIHVFTAVICATVAWFCLQFVLTSREYEDLILGNVPAWWLQSALPIGFGLITWRYLLFLLADIKALFSSEKAR
jgi:TRAP-type C4-dicarboxylate transport system permease small subunit